MDRCLGVELVQKYNEHETIKVDSARCLALYGVHRSTFAWDDMPATNNWSLGAGGGVGRTKDGS